MKKLSILLTFSLAVSIFGATTSHATIWMDELTVFCTKTIECNGAPLEVRGTEDTCIPSIWSFCSPRKCEALTRPVQ